MSFTLQEKNGIVDLLHAEESNIPILIQLAKSVTKNVVDIATTQEAMEYIFIHIKDCITLLNKRAITKEILFKYLHSKNVAVTGDFTKAYLIKKVLCYWNNISGTCEQEQDSVTLTRQGQGDINSSRPTQTTLDVSGSTFNSDLETTGMRVASISEISRGTLNSELTTTTTRIHASHSSRANESEFPINLLARKFSEWFFNNYNQNALKSYDFWSDARLLLRIAANDGCDEHECNDSTSLLDALYDTQQRFSFFFNPNLTHAGVQGRMDVHGLVVVLACGTLHTANDCVGLFECAFGLLRDPFAENNWKTKTVQLMLRSKGAPATPSLEESDTLKEALTLPVPKGDIT